VLTESDQLSPEHMRQLQEACERVAMAARRQLDLPTTSVKTPHR